MLCGTPALDAPLPANVTMGQSQIQVRGGYMCAAGTADRADIVLNQLPNNLVLEHTLSLMSTAAATRRSVLKVAPPLAAALRSGSASQYLPVLLKNTRGAGGISCLNQLQVTKKLYLSIYK